MGSTLSLDLRTRPFVSGMPRLVLQLGSLSRGTLTVCSLLLTLLMDSRSSLGPGTIPSVCGTHLHMFPHTFLHPLTQRMSTFMCNQIQRVGSKTQRVAYYIGYPQT